MKRIVNVLALACTLSGGAVLTRPAPARAMVAPSPIGYLYCCESLDKSNSCCYWTGCAVSTTGCYRIR
ncbi:MAG TPA: hypothetical protein VF771_01700 [Longimicrobiaceae bacterium]